MRTCSSIQLVLLVGCSLDVHGLQSEETTAGGPSGVHELPGFGDLGSDESDAGGVSDDACVPGDDRACCAGRPVGTTCSDEPEPCGRDSSCGDDASVIEVDEDAGAGPEHSDACTLDPEKSEPGVCGCGVPDDDSDGDATPDCQDGCPHDDAKTQAGSCGCGTPDRDTDDDGVVDCDDACPSDPNKSESAGCGCGLADADVDRDGIADCVDTCLGTWDQSGRIGCACPKSGRACESSIPTVSFLEPRSQTVSVGNLTIAADARDEDGSIERVTLYVDGVRARDQHRPPYAWRSFGRGKENALVMLLRTGEHLLELEAVDDDGAVARAQRTIEIEP